MIGLIAYFPFEVRIQRALVMLDPVAAAVFERGDVSREARGLDMGTAKEDFLRASFRRFAEWSRLVLSSEEHSSIILSWMKMISRTLLNAYRNQTSLVEFEFALFLDDTCTRHLSWSSSIFGSLQAQGRASPEM